MSRDVTIRDVRPETRRRIERDLPRSAVVTSDGAAGTALAIEHLPALGHERIAAITGPQATLPARERLSGYRSALAAAGLEPRAEYVRDGDYYGPSGAHAAEALMALPEPPTAIVAASDAMAAGALGAATAAALVGLIARGSPPRRTRVPVELVVRGSTGPAPAA